MAAPRDGVQCPIEPPLPRAFALPLGLPRTRRAEILLGALISSLPLLLYAPFLASPFERDEGVYATVAQGLLAGEIPYRDLFDNKPPLVYAWYAFSFALFGEHVFAPRLLASTLLAGTAFVLFLQVRLLFPVRAAYLAAALFGLAMGVPYVALHANTEAFMMLPLMGSLLAFTLGMARRHLGWFALAGVLAALALMTKQVALWNLVALLLVAPWWRRKQGYAGAHVFLPSLCMAGAALASTALILLPFAVSGALDDFFYANVSYNYRYVGVTSYPQRVFHFKRALLFALYFVGATAPLVAGSLAGLAVTLRRPLSPAYALALAWAVASALGVSMGARFYPHYFLQIVPSLAFFSAIALDAHIEALPARPARPLLAAAASLVLIALVTNGLLWLAPRATEKRLSSDVYHQKQWETASRQLAQYIAARTSAHDRILNYGREAQLYFYADRLPATRFFYDWAYGYDPATLDTTLNHLRSDPPALVIDTVLPPLFKPEDRDPEMDAFLAQYYTFTGRVQFADIYSRR